MHSKEGTPSPLGVTKTETGLNFALFSKHATHVCLLLFRPAESRPFYEHCLDPHLHRTGWIWHILIEGLDTDMLEYAYRIDGPHEECKNRFNAELLLSDPYAKALSTPLKWGAERNFKKHPPRGRILLKAPFDWGEDRPPRIPMQDLIIYEMHVRCFTEHPSSNTRHRGTFLAIIEKIPYLKDLGINAVELMPIFEFDECENENKNPKTQEVLKNLWGYSTINFFAPMNRYSSSEGWTAALDDFRNLVKELHANGIEVILDVVYNHTAEGPLKGPNFSFRGIDNQVYYMTDSTGNYLDFTGTGNTVNANHPVVLRLILDSLRYWVTQMHVDGFRFDLASSLTRDETGFALKLPPLIHLISHDPVLSEVKLIAEPWDAAGLFQVGCFPGEGKWAEWNAKYRDGVRCFLKGTDGYAGTFAKVMCGSQDIYSSDCKPYHSINFITAHDGFTLRDLVSYQQKHNEENAEGNRDGSDHNESWNCGEEGLSDNPHILRIRLQQMKNMLVALLLAIGTPMLLMGDEYGHTRKGNNNAYCQDNTLSWFLWDELEKNQSFARFCRFLIHFRKQHKIFRRTSYLTEKDIDWHSQKPFHPNWHTDNRFVAYTLKDFLKQEHVYIAFNAQFTAAQIALPDAPEGKCWQRIIDTSLDAPEDFIEHPRVNAPLDVYRMAAHSAFIAKAICPDIL